MRREREGVEDLPLNQSEDLMKLGRLSRWLHERRENCLRIAAGKPESDRAGWLEDAKYFEAAIAAVDWASDNGLVRVGFGPSYGEALENLQ